MLGTSILGLGRLGYGAIYVVPATYLYIFITDAMISLPYISGGTLRLLAVTLLALSLYAAIWMHHVGLLIFGDLAGMRSSKPDEVLNKHITYFVTGVTPSRLPDTASLVDLLFAAYSSDDMRWGVHFRAIPATLLFPYSIIAWAWLSGLFFAGSVNLITGVFWLVLTVLITRKRITGYLPDYVPRESIAGITEAEYVRTRRLVNKEVQPENRPRIQKKDS